MTTIRGAKALKYLLRNCCQIEDLSSNGLPRYFVSWIIRRSSWSLQTSILNIAKIPLLKWPVGAEFSGGPHSINQLLPLYYESAALLHFTFSRGISGFRYVSQRGLHYQGSSRYKYMLAEKEK